MSDFTVSKKIILILNGKKVVNNHSFTLFECSLHKFLSVEYFAEMHLCGETFLSFRMYFSISPAEDSTMNPIQCQDVRMSRDMQCFWTAGGIFGLESGVKKTGNVFDM